MRVVKAIACRLSIVCRDLVVRWRTVGTLAVASDRQTERKAMSNSTECLVVASVAQLVAMSQ